MTKNNRGVSMRTRAWMGVSICTLALGVVACGTPGGGNPPGDSAREDEILAIVNMRRAQGATCGTTVMPPVPALVHNEQLRLASRRHSADMAMRNYFSHDTPEGKSPFDRITETGYSGSPQGENIAAGNSTASATMTQWMNSEGHCKNIMNAQYKSIGIGYGTAAGSTYTHYWTQTFGGR